MLLSYPPELPISGLKNDIVQAVRDHQVLVIAGDTGSGKTTQIPKMCLEAGRGTTGIIGCTQPRRIAAVAVADRVAAELQDNRRVGYKIRFRDRTCADTLIKFMTDGVLLAETRQDRELRRYDTLIIDEAHERSLNIDFLLGYLKTLLRRRPELKLIISSATIDTEKFSSHFDHAPVIQVSGRTFPITMEYCPPEDADQGEGESYVEPAVRETVRLATETTAGDILVFMPTERDIRDSVEMLRKRLAGRALVLPLFGRLQAADQRKIFRPARLRKIIVATNVAETSITVPGIRSVVDTGLARLARYNVRAGTTSLQVTRISQASCEQRAGRCGRTGPGLCVRLYSREDYLARPPFTQPEIQRSNLAEVILQMISLRLGDPREFPFIDPPAPRSIRDGYGSLHELGAITPANRLTPRGRIMARLPLDPGISRIIIEGAELGALREVKVIAAGLSIQDPRIRPADKEDQADEMHRRFRVKNSDFLSLLMIWDTFHSTMNQVGSQAKLRKFCQSHFLSWQRMREWLDIHDQISRLLRHEKGFSENEQPASFAAVHQALLCGFLRHIGQKKEKNIYRISGGREAMIFPGSALYNQGGQWVVAASFMETSRLFALNAAVIDVRWLERLGGDLCRRSWSEPHWEKKTGRVTALEKTTLFGLIIVAGRKVNYGRINAATGREAREIFIRSALIQGELGGSFPFLQHNLALISRYQDMEERLRRRNIVFDEQVLYAFYDERLGPVHDRHTLKLFLRARKGDRLLMMTEDDICRARPDENELYRFPRTLRTGQGELPLSYRFEPGHEADGITVDLPLPLVPGLSPALFEWLVPGLLPEKILALLKALPKKLRRQLVPLPNAADLVMDELELYRDSLYPGLEKALRKHFQVSIRRTDWQTGTLPVHLKMRYRLVGEEGRILFAGRSFRELLNRCRDGSGSAARPAAIQHAGPPGRKGIRAWDFARAPEPVTGVNQGNGLGVLFFPALFIDEKSQSLELRYIDDKARSFALNRDGLRFLYSLRFGQEIKALRRQCKAAVASHSASWLSLGPAAGGTEIQVMLLHFILDDIFGIRDGELPTEREFEAIATTAKEKGIVREGVKRLDRLLRLLGRRRLVSSRIAAFMDRAKASRNFSENRFQEYRQHLQEIMPSSFLTTKKYPDLQHTERYLKALAIRMERAEQAPAKDAAKSARLEAAVNRLQHLPDTDGRSAPCIRLLAEYRLMVDEFRVSIFAPELGVAIPVSEKRLQKKWQELENQCHAVES